MRRRVSLPIYAPRGSYIFAAPFFLSPLSRHDAIVNMLVDLHCHSTASDGALDPRAVYQRAKERGVDLLALTDHDSIEGYLALKAAKELDGPALVPGIEFSARNDALKLDNVHIVGLGFDPDDPAFQQFLAVQQGKRAERAQQIAAKVEKLGISDVMRKVEAKAGINDTGARGADAGSGSSGGRKAEAVSIGRPHFAKVLIDEGYAKGMQQAFTRFLGQGKRCYVRLEWPEMADIIGTIHAAGGKAVLAHPDRYRLTRTKRTKLIRHFHEASGDAIELISGLQDRATTHDLSLIARELDLAVSLGSDFHTPEPLINDLGCTGELEDAFSHLRPVWQDLAP